MTDKGGVNALLAFEPPQWTLDDQIQSLITRFGADSVRDATKRLTAKRRGRKQERDWPLLTPYLEQDALDWLNGRAMAEFRSNYSIAKEVSHRNPGQSAPSTHRRLMGKLRKDRATFTLYFAMTRAEKDRPHNDLMRVLTALSELDGVAGRIGRRGLDFRSGQLLRFREWFGEPDPGLTFAQIETELSKPRLLPQKPSALGGLFDQSRT